MVNAYKCTGVTVKIDDNTLGVVESLTMELEWEGGLENVYGTEDGKHVLGGKRASFTVRRWYWVDTDTDLFVDIFDGKLPFSLSGELAASAGKILLSDCMAYRYRPVYGAPNDKVGEELSGEAAAWELP